MTDETRMIVDEAFPYVVGLLWLGLILWFLGSVAVLVSGLSVILGALLVFWETSRPRRDHLKDKTE